LSSLYDRGVILFVIKISPQNKHKTNKIFLRLIVLADDPPTLGGVGVKMENFQIRFAQDFITLND